MNKLLLPVTVAGVLAAAGWLAAQPAGPARPAGEPELIARGRHLAERVALCADCHTPRLGTGALDPARGMQGAPIGFKPLAEMPWAPVAPALAGLPGRTDAAVISVLTTGRRTDGSAPLPPMPAFGLSVDEARAVVAYLRSLPPAP